MNRIILLLIVSLVSCNSKNKINLKYSREVYIDSSNNDKRVEYYQINDTNLIKNQIWYYKDNSIDTLRSQFYKLEMMKSKHKNKKNNYKIQGKLNLFHNNTKIKSRLSQTNLRLWLGYYKNRKLNYYEFTSENKRLIEFEYESRNDTLFGILFITKSYDTIVKGEKMIRLTEEVLWIDNKMQTNNPFVDTFATNH